MKTIHISISMRLLAGIAVLGLVGFSAPVHAAPKKVLVVTVTKGFRHSSIPTAEKVLGELGKKSGVFEVDYVRNDEEMAKKMTAAALKGYDGVIFANTTGDLPLPDKQAFLDWIKSGKGFMGMHSATDTFRGKQPLDPYVEMIGGEFKDHKAQVEVECINEDPKHPACKPLGQTFRLKDEIYLLNGFYRARVRGLLRLDKHPNEKTPGDYPIAWCKEYGKGRVFYTSLGHREDVWDPNEPKRENPKEVAEA
jgi:type 1 glutamine amidotransferase